MSGEVIIPRSARIIRSIRMDVTKPDDDNELRKYCPHCLLSIEYANYCHQCGAELVAKLPSSWSTICRVCGVGNKDYYKYCSNCGAKLGKA